MRDYKKKNNLGPWSQPLKVRSFDCLGNKARQASALWLGFSLKDYNLMSALVTNKHWADWHPPGEA